MIQTLDVLLTRFNGQILIPLSDAAHALGLAEQTVRNQLHQKTFPIPTVLQGSRRFIAVQDMASYVDRLKDHSREKSKRGAPSKGERKAADDAGLTIKDYRESLAQISAASR